MGTIGAVLAMKRSGRTLRQKEEELARANREIGVLEEAMHAQSSTIKDEEMGIRRAEMKLLRMEQDLLRQQIYGSEMDEGRPRNNGARYRQARERTQRTAEAMRPRGDLSGPIHYGNL